MRVPADAGRGLKLNRQLSKIAGSFTGRLWAGFGVMHARCLEGPRGYEFLDTDSEPIIAAVRQATGSRLYGTAERPLVRIAWKTMMQGDSD